MNCPECRSKLTSPGSCACGWSAKKGRGSDRCAYETHRRHCPLHAHCDQYCAYHSARVHEHFTTEDAEYTWFLDWCQRSQRWNLCLWNPGLLWRILCGLVPSPITEGQHVPQGAWRCPADDVRQAWVEGRMSNQEYFGGYNTAVEKHAAQRKGPSARANAREPSPQGPVHISELIPTQDADV